MRWFGESWNAPCCRRTAHVATPVGQLCVGCERPIEVTDQGFRVIVADLGGGESNYHRLCLYASVGVKMTVHILRYGFSLCRFNTEVPARWPQGHIWGTRSEATCDACKREHDARHDH